MISLVRGEDLVDRLRDDEFCIVEPDTAPELADYALQRIAGVVGKAEFRVLGVEQQIKVILKTSCSSLAPGDDTEALIGRARAACIENRKLPLDRSTKPLPVRRRKS